jgi:O-acetyl-ADP-ribose deacetylase (regulator of RNase III)
MKTIKGDLIKLAEQGEFDIIVHGCNCFHAMGSGIAGQLATKYPQVLEADRNQTEYGDRDKLGSYTSAYVEVDGNIFTVVNVYSQYKWSLGSDVFEYDAFQKFLNNQVEFLGYYNPSSLRRKRIGFPMIGAGLAGGDWSRISKMIEKFSENVAPYADVTVVEYQP